MQAVTNNLEKLILKGKASYNIYNLAFGMFGGVPITPGNTAIITNIIYYPFLNPIKDINPDNLSLFTWRDLLSYIEYQLKIEGKKSTNFHQFRNDFNITILDPTLKINLDDKINVTNIKNHFLFGTKHPIQIPTYQVCEEFIKLTISRNANIFRVANNYDLLNNDSANELETPNGVSNINLLLNSRLANTDLNTQFYYPPNIENSGSGILGDRSAENYNQDIYGKGLNSYNSQLTDLQDMEGNNADLLNINPYGSYPLVSIGYVLINKNAFDELINN